MKHEPAATARKTFANNLDYYMRLRGVDQADIVTKLNVSASTASDWVNGKKYPRVDSMQRLADFLGVVLSDLTTADRKTPWYEPIYRSYEKATPAIRESVCKLLDIPHITPPPNTK